SAMILAIGDEPARGELVHSGDMPQERDARGVEIDADEVDAAFDDGFQRLLELLGIHVVLIESDADVLRLDLDELREWVLKPPANGDGAPQRGVMIGKLFAADGAGGIDAGAGLVDDYVGQSRELRIGGGGSRRRRGGSRSGRPRCGGF